MSSKRRKAREIALKVLYQVDLVGKDPQDSFEQVLCDENIRPTLESVITDVLNKSGAGPGSDGDGACAVDSCLSEILSIRKTKDFGAAVLESVRKSWSDSTLAKDLTQRIVEKISSFSPLESFAQELVDKTTGNQSKIDEILTRFADNWSLDRMATIDRAILRFAICELLFFRDIPVNVTINEAVELAKKYSTERSREFVNGILDKVQRECKPEKVEPKEKNQSEKTSDTPSES